MSRSTRSALVILAGLALLAATGWLLVTARPLLVALTIGALLAFLFDPAARRLSAKLRGHRGLAATLIFVGVLAISAGLATGAGVLAVNLWPRIQDELLQISAQVQVWLEQPITLFDYTIDPQILLENVGTAASNAVSTFTLGSDGLLAGLSENLIWSLVVVISFYYLLRDGPALRPWVLDLIPAAARGETEVLWDEIVTVWGVFLRMQLLIFAVLGVLLASSTALVLWFFRQGWLQLSPFGLILLLIVLYAAIQQVDNLWLRPRLMGGPLELHPGIVVVALLGMLALSGLLGALLIVPVLATVKVLARYGYAKVMTRYGWNPLPRTRAEAAATAVDAEGPAPEPIAE